MKTEFKPGEQVVILKDQNNWPEGTIVTVLKKEELHYVDFDRYECEKDGRKYLAHSNCIRHLD